MKNILPSLLILFLSSCAIFSNKNTAGKFPIYGNWCGPDHPKKETNPQPIDATDQACKNHDKCYEEYGYLNSYCDQTLISQLRNVVPQNEIEDIANKAIIYYFERSPKL
jgi:hypothetical protein